MQHTETYIILTTLITIYLT